MPFLPWIMAQASILPFRNHSPRTTPTLPRKLNSGSETGSTIVSTGVCLVCSAYSASWACGDPGGGSAAGDKKAGSPSRLRPNDTGAGGPPSTAATRGTALPSRDPHWMLVGALGQPGSSGGRRPCRCAPPHVRLCLGKTSHVAERLPGLRRREAAATRMSGKPLFGWGPAAVAVAVGASAVWAVPRRRRGSQIAGF